MLTDNQMNAAKKYLAEQTEQRRRKAAIHVIVHRYAHRLSYSEATCDLRVGLGLGNAYGTEMATAWHTAQMLREVA